MDKISYNEALITNLIKRNRPEEAIPYIKDLLEMNSDNHDYHDLLMKASKPALATREMLFSRSSSA